MTESKKDNYVFISALKIIASIMIVVLHAVQNGGGTVQRCIYLSGSFGIPLFFIANGYLLYERDFTVQYVKKKGIRIIQFLLLWILTYGGLKALVKKDPLIILTIAQGVFLGKSDLYHLWFLITLLLIYIIVGLVQFIMKKKCKFKQIINNKAAAIIFVLMQVVFAYCIFSSFNDFPEIREFVPPFLRLITYGGFFLLGMYVHKFESTLREKCNSAICVVLFFASYIAICLIGECTGIIWASSYYDSVFVVIGCISLMIVFMKINYNKTSDSIINKFAFVTTGVWILHPFAMRVFEKCLSLVNIERSIVIRVIEVVLIYFSCAIVTFICSKNKLLNKYISI